MVLGQTDDSRFELIGFEAIMVYRKTGLDASRARPQPGPPRENFGTAFQALVIQESLLWAGARPSLFRRA